MLFFPLVLRLPCLVKEYWGGPEALARQTWAQAAKPGKSLCSYGSVICSTPTKKYQGSSAVLPRKIPPQKVARPVRPLCPHRPKTSSSCPDTGSWGCWQRESHKHPAQTALYSLYAGKYWQAKHQTAYVPDTPFSRREASGSPTSRNSFHPNTALKEQVGTR